MLAREPIRSPSRAQDGFTLVEMLVVITIIGLIMGLVGPRVLNYLSESKVKAARIQIASLASSLDLYYLDAGRYPSSAEGLTALVERPGGVASWSGPYLKGGAVPKDPWGHPYLYRMPGEHGPYDIVSYGSDGQEGGPARPPISRAGYDNSAAAEAGFTLIEIVCVLAIVAMLAAILLPAIPHATSRARLEAYAIETASLLKADRYAAIRSRRQIATELSAAERSIRSGASDRAVVLPGDVHFDAMLAARCGGRAAGTTIDFFPSGMSCGGTIALTRPGGGFQVRVNWLTGGVEVVPINVL